MLDMLRNGYGIFLKWAQKTCTTDVNITCLAVLRHILSFSNINKYVNMFLNA
jgi:hypothetical protein